jgi:hypothetical protein
MLYRAKFSVFLRYINTQRHNEELNDLYSSPNTFRVIKSGRTKWAGLVVRMGERRGIYMILMGKLQGKRPF